MKNFFKNIFSRKTNENLVETTPVVETIKAKPEPSLEYLLGQAVKRQDIDEMYRLLKLGANPNGYGIYESNSYYCEDTFIPGSSHECRIIDLNYEYGNSSIHEGLKYKAVDKLLRSFGGRTSDEEHQQYWRELERKEKKEKREAENARQKRVDELLNE
ncbi:MAG: hypothetical protein SO141_00375 [Alphaproteobacteria bacterium]|nr:hypothetical protein [Alphaproteobacteria bacterium]